MNIFLVLVLLLAAVGILVHVINVLFERSMTRAELKAKQENPSEPYVCPCGSVDFLPAHHAIRYTGGAYNGEVSTLWGASNLVCVFCWERRYPKER